MDIWRAGNSSSGGLHLWERLLRGSTRSPFTHTSLIQSIRQQRAYKLLHHLNIGGRLLKSSCISLSRYAGNFCKPVWFASSFLVWFLETKICSWSWFPCDTLHLRRGSRCSQSRGFSSFLNYKSRLLEQQIQVFSPPGGAIWKDHPPLVQNTAEPKPIHPTGCFSIGAELAQQPSPILALPQWWMCTRGAFNDDYSCSGLVTLGKLRKQNAFPLPTQYLKLLHIYIKIYYAYKHTYIHTYIIYIHIYKIYAYIKYI